MALLCVTGQSSLNSGPDLPVPQSPYFLDNTQVWGCLPPGTKPLRDCPQLGRTTPTLFSFLPPWSLLSLGNWRGHYAGIIFPACCQPFASGSYVLCPFLEVQKQKKKHFSSPSFLSPSFTLLPSLCYCAWISWVLELRIKNKLLAEKNLYAPSGPIARHPPHWN